MLDRLVTRVARQIRLRDGRLHRWAERGVGNGMGDGGERIHEQMGPEQIELECTRAISAPGVTHLTFRVVK